MRERVRLQSSRPAVKAALDALGTRLRAERLSQGLRLADVAAMCDLSEAYISRIESGERLPSLPAFLTLAAVYGRDPTDMVRESDGHVSVTAHHAGAMWDGSEEQGVGVMFHGSRRVPFDRTQRLTASVDRVLEGVENSGSPEELVAMAFSGCFAMSLAHDLEAAGYDPQHIEATADVQLEHSADAIGITGIDATCRAVVARIQNPVFQELAHQTKRSCVMSRALAAVPIRLEATLVRSRSAAPRKPTRRV
jgi:osmotically inducible protein OsmC